jgi:hypothetical protein
MEPGTVCLEYSRSSPGAERDGHLLVPRFGFPFAEHVTAVLGHDA